METVISGRIRNLLGREGDQSDGAFGEALHIRFLGYDGAQRAYLFAACAEPWMRNIDGVVHGGFCAAIADHTMGIVAYCAKEQDRVAPTIQLQVSYHRPLPPGVEMQVCVRLISATSRLIHLSMEASDPRMPGNIYFSSNATYFCKV